MMKICYCIEALYNSRGTERVLTQCANMLCEDAEITIVTAFQNGQPDFYSLSEKIRRVDLGVTDYKNNSFFSNPRKKEYKKKLNVFLLQEHFDIVISLGGLESQFLHKIKDGSKKILWFHFAFDISNLFIKENHKGFIANVMVWLQTKRRVWFANKMDKVVVISKSDKQIWDKHCKNVTSIYNPVTISSNNISLCNQPAAIAVGVLGVQKGFDFLINAWSQVYLKHPDWHLDIFGDGPDKSLLQEQITSNGLQNVVHLKGRTNDIVTEYLNHSLYIMSSRAEGFGLVLVEAAECGLPLISYDCNYGPNEIIIDGDNGILIKEVGDINGLSDAINTLINNPDKRKEMGIRAKELNKRFSESRIKKQWIDLFNDILKYDLHTMQRLHPLRLL